MAILNLQDFSFTCLNFLSKTIDDFLDKFKEEMKEFNMSTLYRGNDDPHNYATFAYDAVWTMALALHNADADLKSVLTYITLFHSFFH